MLPGIADLLVAADIEAGNALYKMLGIFRQRPAGCRYPWRRSTHRSYFAFRYGKSQSRPVSSWLLQ